MQHKHTLGEADFTPCQYVLEGSWAGAESTSRIFTQALIEINFCLKDVISSSDDKAELIHFHAPQVLPADPPLLHSTPLVSTVLVYRGRLP